MRAMLGQRGPGRIALDVLRPLYRNPPGGRSTSGGLLQALRMPPAAESGFRRWDVAISAGESSRWLCGSGLLGMRAVIGAPLTRLPVVTVVRHG